MLLIKFRVQVFQVGKGQLLREGSFTQDQVTHALLNNVAGGKSRTQLLMKDPYFMLRLTFRATSAFENSGLSKT